MAGLTRPNVTFRICAVDRLGRTISPLVVDAAEHIGLRAIRHAERLRVDPAVAANLLDEAAAAVSRAIGRKKDSPEDPVRDLRAYLFRAFIRRVNKTVRRQLLAENAARILFVTSQNSSDPLMQLERKIFIDELLAKGDPSTRDMFYRRSQGLLWHDIGPSYGISAHAAESRFSLALKKIRKILGLEKEK